MSAGDKARGLLGWIAEDTKDLNVVTKTLVALTVVLILLLPGVFLVIAMITAPDGGEGVEQKEGM